MGAIGGYFELELSRKDAYHKHVLALNTGRNAFEYILRLRNYSKVYIPYFTCDVLLEPLQKLEIDYEFYSIDEHLEPLFDFASLKKEEGFLYTNYFGLKDLFIEKIALSCSCLIIDNAQAFFSKPRPHIDTFYSPRKFFGVSDGAYVSTDKLLEDALEQDWSCERMDHLLLRADRSAEEGYADFVKNDRELINLPIRKMSILTQKIMQSIDYAFSMQQRRANFLYLQERLQNSNHLKFNLLDHATPMVYPYWTKDTRLKNRLLENRIYCPSYWPNVLDWCEEGSLELKLMKEVVYLPIDQRYDEKDMKKILAYV